jgi:hypothetical protein
MAGKAQPPDNFIKNAIFGGLIEDIQPGGVGTNARRFGFVDLDWLELGSGVRDFDEETGKEVGACSSDIAQHVQTIEGHVAGVEEFNYLLSPTQRLPLT